MIRLRVDEPSGALYLRLRDASISESEEVHPGVVLDFDAEGELVGIEVWQRPDRAE